MEGEKKVFLGARWKIPAKNAGSGGVAKEGVEGTEERERVLERESIRARKSTTSQKKKKEWEEKKIKTEIENKPFIMWEY